MAQAAFVAEAISLYLVDTGKRTLLFRRLVRWSNSGESGRDWRMSTLKDQPVGKEVRADVVMFLATDGGRVTRYGLAGLQALRAQMTRSIQQA